MGTLGAAVIATAVVIVGVVPLLAGRAARPQTTNPASLDKARLEMHRIKRRFDLAGFRLQAKLEAAEVRRELGREAAAIRAQRAGTNQRRQR